MKVLFKSFSLLLALWLLTLPLTGCASEPMVMEVTRVVPQTVEVTRLVTAEPSATPEVPPTEAPTSTLAPTPTQAPVVVAPRPTYIPLKGCAGTRLKVGDKAMVTYGGGPNAIRSSADVNASENIIGEAAQGEVVEIIGGPECSFGWILWLVRTSSGIEGYTPESDGTSFWLQP